LIEERAGQEQVTDERSKSNNLQKKQVRQDLNGQIVELGVANNMSENGRDPTVIGEITAPVERPLSKILFLTFSPLKSDPKSQNSNLKP
jgi:hypothetical protein